MAYPQSTADRRPRHATRLSPWQALAATALINTLIAGFLTLLHPSHGFAISLLYSQAIGLSTCLLAIPVVRSSARGLTRLLLTLAAILGGTVIGLGIGWFVTGWPAADGRLLGVGGQAVAVGMIFGIAVSALFALRERLAGAERALAQEQLSAASAERSAVEMELRMLQAQIEPHFLFNTLANVVSLIEVAPPEARRLLEETIRYLRATLARARSPSGTLGQELGIVEAYLAILQMRLGKRLTWRIELADDLRELACPPLLLQPLVENAVKHGIEPQVDGGSVTIRAERSNARLSICVADTGRGLDGPPRAAGVGLANVRERLAALYGEAAGLQLSANTPRGAVACIELPAQGTQS